MLRSTDDAGSGRAAPSDEAGVGIEREVGAGEVEGVEMDAGDAAIAEPRVQDVAGFVEGFEAEPGRVEGQDKEEGAFHVRTSYMTRDGVWRGPGSRQVRARERESVAPPGPE